MEVYEEIALININVAIDVETKIVFLNHDVAN